MSRCRSRSSIALSILVLLTCGTLVGSAEPETAEPWKNPAARIAQHRQTPITVQVVDRDNKPIPGLKVNIEQTRHAFLFGCNVYKWGTTNDPEGEAAYRRQFAELFNFATLKFYWASYERAQGKPEYDYTGQVARWCLSQNILPKGHPLAWNHSEPNWLPDDSQQVFQLQLDRVEDCVTRFQGTIGMWDVVNEVVAFDRPHFAERAPRLTKTWADVGQIEFTKQCFQRARKANPEATLLINDYRLDPEYERVIEQLVDDNGKPWYDVIGIQSHQHGGTWNNQRIWEVCERYAKYGVPLHFTETTILSGKRPSTAEPWTTNPEGEEFQVREIERFYEMLYSHPAVEAITWWDFSDQGAWQQAPAGLVRKDMTPKPAYKKLHEMIKQRWWTKFEGQADGEGQVKLTATYGDYRITIREADKTVYKGDLAVVRDDSNRYTVQID